MKAVARSKYGDASVIEIIEMDVPKPKEHELLIRVHATTVNRTDCAILTGKPFIMKLMLGLISPKYSILGTDFAGKVVEVGSGVTKFEKGDRVWGFEDNGALGSQAEYMTIHKDKTILTIPDEVSYEVAAASPEAGHYGYNFINKIQISPGQKILVNGGTGAIGAATIQFLKHHGLEVTATCRKIHFDHVKKLGAVKVIDYEKEDFTATTEKYDHIFDTVGKSTFGKCKPLLKPKGKYISSELGPGGQNILLMMTTPLTGGKRCQIAIPVKPLESLGKIRELWLSKEFSPLIDRTYPMDQIKEAYTYVASGSKVGNVVISY